MVASIVTRWVHREELDECRDTEVYFVLYTLAWGYSSIQPELVLRRRKFGCPEDNQMGFPTSRSLQVQQSRVILARRSSPISTTKSTGSNFGYRDG